jgi:NAD(P)-dependent dehydrogenase (short-subunit alcohol dehydrogenase family)
VAQAIGGAAEFLALDATDPDGWAAVIADIVAQHGGVDVLVNNAGTGTGGGTERETEAEHRRVMELNVTGVWLGHSRSDPGDG